jgi:hypothetical protein
VCCDKLVKPVEAVRLDTVVLFKLHVDVEAEVETSENVMELLPRVV